MNNIIHKYSVEYTTVAQPPGFGDFISGTFFLISNKSILNKNIYVDYEEHPIQNFLINKNNYTNIASIKNKYIFEFFNTDKNDIIKNLNQKNNDLFVATNNKNYFLTTDNRNFVKNSFIPNDELVKHINIEKNNLNLNCEYNTLHIRTGDHNMHKEINDDNFLSIIFNFLKNYDFKQKLFIISDNLNIKNIIKSFFPYVCVSQNEPIHLGKVKNLNLEEIKNTLIDFFIMSNSKKIFTFSVYGGSGFSKTCSEIFDIDIKNIN
jgi:sporulation protein YlmC with PRC-barrel domain